MKFELFYAALAILTTQTLAIELSSEAQPKEKNIHDVLWDCHVMVDQGNKEVKKYREKIIAEYNEVKDSLEAHEMRRV